ncbi:MAG: ferritin family protein [Chloroflexota bacterium]|nr:ferritin family protein [Chloroflexota bacterium]
MQDTNSALSILRRAMKGERDGYRFYVEASQRSADPAGAGTFRNLANAEEDHLRLIFVEYQSLSAGQGWVAPEEAMAREVEVDIAKPLPWEEAESKETPFSATWAAYEVDGLAGDLAALEFGLDMEKKFYKMYQEAAAQAEEPQARQAYGFLMKEENKHYKILQDAYDYLSDNKHWWDDWELPFFEG